MLGDSLNEDLTQALNLLFVTNMTHYTLLSCIESKRFGSNKLYAQFALGNFLQGQSLTIANTLRRALLSQLVGAAICFVEIPEASQEYESLPGVKECVLDLLLQLRQITLASDVDLFKTQVGYINVKGPGVVRARDLKLPSFLKVVQPNQYIATLSSKGHLNMKVLINCGKTYLTHNPGSATYNHYIMQLKKRSWVNLGYYPNFYQAYSSHWQRQKSQLKQKNKALQLDTVSLKQESGVKPVVQPLTQVKRQDREQAVQKKTKKKTKKKGQRITTQQLVQKIPESSIPGQIGFFPIDAVFSPVLKVTYSIESVSKTAEKIYFEIWTNGSIDPRDAIHKAVVSIIELFLPLQSTCLNPLPSLSTWFKPNTSKAKVNHRVPMLLKDLEQIDPHLHDLARVQARKWTAHHEDPDSMKQLHWFKTLLQQNPKLFSMVWKQLFRPDKTTLPFRLGVVGVADQIEPISDIRANEILLREQDPTKHFTVENCSFFAESTSPKPRNKDHLAVISRKKQDAKKKLKTQLDQWYDEEKQREVSLPAFTRTLEEAQMQRKQHRKSQLKKRLLLQRKVDKTRFKLTLPLLRDFLSKIGLVDLQLPSRIYACLHRNDINYVGDLMATSKLKLSQSTALNLSDVDKIQRRLREYVFAFLMI